MPMRFARMAPAAALAIATMSAGLSSAGGSRLKFDQASYQPGDVAHAVAAVSYSHNTELGRPDGGPYFVYLAPFAAVEPGPPGVRWPYLPPGAVRVGDVAFRAGPVQEPGTDFLTGPDHVEAEFAVPDLSPGTYAAVVCDDPCRSSIGDVVHGRLTVAAAADRSPEVTTRPAVITPTVLISDESTSGSLGRPAATAAALGAVLVGGMVVARRRRRTPEE